MSSAFLPLLRSPPFPWVASDVAAVSAPGQSTLSDPERLFAAMRTARVGGAFWGTDDPWADAGTSDPAGERAIAAWLAGGSVDGKQRDVAIARIEAATYRDPFTGAAIDAHRAVAILALWRRMIDANRPLVAAVGMAGWKRAAMAQFLWTGSITPRFASPETALARAAAGDAIAYWPSRTPASFVRDASRGGAAAWQVEDGFLRSAGLGVECRPPMSVLIDRSGGIHFDPAAVSELEMILATHPFDQPLRDRAGALRARIVAARLGKYGVDRASGRSPPLPDDRRIVLAVGQVEDDLSVVRGGVPGGMQGFLARVRAAEPDAFIVYRPHPDVVTGLRRGGSGDAGAADLVVSGGSLLALIERADAVHVLSSLTGFEALLRNVPVTVHGTPFYAGWGLTRDLSAPLARRARVLTLDELVAGALILAPRYRDPVTELPCEPETLIDRLIADPVPATSAISGFRRAYGVARRTFGGVERRA